MVIILPGPGDSSLEVGRGSLLGWLVAKLPLALPEKRRLAPAGEYGLTRKLA